MKRIFILILTLGIIMLFNIAAFGQSKPKSIKLMVDGTFQVKENGEQVLVDSFKKLTGIDLVLNHPIHNEYYSKVDLAFTTGNYPEVLILGGNQYVKYAQAGMLADLTALYNASKFKKNIKDLSLVEALKINGKLYGIPFERGNGTITYVRGDWLEKLNMKAPTNYAEFLDMLRAFKNKNPDGLTPDQVIPITAAGLMNTEYPLDIYLREFYQSATPDFVQLNGKWVDGMAQSNIVDALERMRSAYAEGLIDKEIITNKTSTARDKWNTGKVGVFNYWAGQWNLNLQLTLTPNVPQGKVTPIKPIKETFYVERPATVYAITKATKDPKSIFKYFHEFILDGGVGQTWATFGAEGVFHKVVDGKVKWLPSLQDPKKPFTKAVISPEIPINNWNSRYSSPELVTNSLNMFQASSKAYGLIPFSEEANELVPDLNFIRSKYVAKIVFGEMTVKEGLDGYAKEARKYVNIILKELNQNIKK
jgi:putative aldouronate transport system substrate-binding protein